MRRQRRAGCGCRRRHGPAAGQRSCPGRRCWRTTTRAGNRQRVGLRQLGLWRGRWRRSGRDIRRCPGRCHGPRGRLDRCARRQWRLSLLDQGGALHDGLRDSGTCRRGTAGDGRCQARRPGRGARRRRGRLVDHGVDDRGVVDVIEDDVVRRRRDIDRRTIERRDRHEHRLRQHEQADHGQRRRQHDEIGRRRRTEIDRRRRRRHEVEHGIAEIQHRTIDIDHLLRRRWRHVVVDHRKGRRRLGRRGEDRQASARIGRMRAARIAAHIRPIGLRRVGPIGPSPCDGFAACGDDRHHALGERIAGIGHEKLLIGRQGVALERGGIGILHAEIADRLAPDCGDLVGRSLRRRRIGSALEERELRRYFLLIPGHLRALGGLVDAQANAVEHLGQRQAAGADHLGERLCIDSVRPLLLRRHRAGRGVEGDQHVRLGLDQRQTARDRLTAFDKGLRAGRVEHHDIGLERNGRELARIVTDAHGLGRYVGVAGDVGIDRDEIVLAGQLHAVAGEIDHRDGARSRSLGLLNEIAHALAQRVAVEIARADHIEAGRLQRLRDQAGIIGRRRQWRLGIGAVADHECNALFRLLRARLIRRGGGKSHDRQQKADEGSECPTHGLLARFCC